MRPRVVLLVALLAVQAPLAAAEGDAETLVALPAGLTAQDLAARGVPVLESFDFAGVALVAGDPAAVGARLAPLGAKAYPVEPITLLLAETRALVGADSLPIAPSEAGAGVAVAVVDSGVDESHPSLSGRVVAHVRVSERGAQRAEGDSTGHGTHVAGILAGTGGDRPNLRGVAPGANLVAVDIRDAFTTTNAIRAFRWISEHADEHEIRVVSNSWGREKDGARHDADDPLTRAVDALVRQGLVVVFSAGNRGPGASTLTQEAMNPNVVTVGATDDRGRLEDYSGRGPAIGADGAALAHAKPDILAPGTAVVSARAGGGWTVMNGTSMAAPHVAAAAAVLVARFPDLAPQETRDLLVGAAERGVLDLPGALAAAAELRRVAVERRIPVALSGELVAVAGRALPVAEADGGAIVVPPGARAVELRVSWEGVAPEGVTATLVHERGAEVSVARLASPAELAVPSPEAGAWTLRVEPRGAADRVSWRAEGAIVATEWANATAPGRMDKASDPGAFDLPGKPAGGLHRVFMVTAAFALMAGVVGVRRRL